MNEFYVSIPSGVDIRPLHDNKSAFVFIENPGRVALIGPLALVICSLISRGGHLKVIDIRKTLLEHANYSSSREQRSFDNAILCAIGQLNDLQVIQLKGVETNEAS